MIVELIKYLAEQSKQCLVLCTKLNQNVSKLHIGHVWQFESIFHPAPTVKTNNVGQPTAWCMAAAPRPRVQVLWTDE